MVSSLRSVSAPIPSGSLPVIMLYLMLNVCRNGQSEFRPESLPPCTLDPLFQLCSHTTFISTNTPILPSDMLVGAEPNRCRH